MAAPSRRTFLKIAALGSAALAAGGYTAHRGLRLPPFRWDPRPTAQSVVIDDLKISASDCIFLDSKPKETPSADRRSKQTVSLRAYAPEPILDLSCESERNIELSLNNVAPDAVLEISGDDHIVSVASESIVGINRTLVISIGKKSTCRLSWKLPTLGEYTFAAIGDSGGADELDWCIRRAHALDARFLLHLGDFNYQDGDYENAIRLFHNAPLPCYVAIGNHDFHENGPVYKPFLEKIGPLNHHFSIGKTRFVNLDTASTFIPYGAGARGRLFDEIIADASNYVDSVAFSHRPLYDPIVEGGHDIGNKGERDWLISSLKKAQIKTLLSGHIHIYDRRTVEGVDNIIVGQGLGHQDLITKSDYSKIALGRVNQAGFVNVEIANLDMPMEVHCHPRSDTVKQSLSGPEYFELLERIEEQCDHTG